ncbi:MAG: hypothetical protein M5U28_51080 [Sandaracinaceae bacterium]|nr:hypothetical protein [Sandaracinaceae bacterium]
MVACSSPSRRAPAPLADPAELDDVAAVELPDHVEQLRRARGVAERGHDLGQEGGRQVVEPHVIAARHARAEGGLGAGAIAEVRADDREEDVPQGRGGELERLELAAILGAAAAAQEQETHHRQRVHADDGLGVGHGAVELGGHAHALLRRVEVAGQERAGRVDHRADEAGGGVLLAAGALRRARGGDRRRPRRRPRGGPRPASARRGARARRLRATPPG